MRKLQHILLTATMLIFSLTAQAQAKMTVELKNGTNLSFYISEINKISWTEGNDTPTGGDNNPSEQTVTGDATDVTSYSAKVTCYANNILENEATDLKVGIIYTDEGTPSKSNGKKVTVSKSSIGSDGKYTVNLTDLKENTTYQYRSFVYQSGIYFLGQVKSFTTKPLQAAVTLYTGDATNVNCYSAKVSAQVLIDASSVYSKLSYGICYGTTAEPTKQLQVTSKDASGMYSTTLKGLAGGTVYYYRPYANMDGTILYGSVSSFRTSDDNVVETGEAEAFGFVKSKLTISGGAYSKLELGICFSTSNSIPTVNDYNRETNELDDNNCYTLSVLRDFGKIYYRSYVKIDGTAHYGQVKHCTISESVIATSGAVDLGLSVKWAACNIGALSPEEYGNYYAFAETETKYTYNESTYLDSTNHKYGTDKKTQLDLDDDVAHVKWGGDWRIPTDVEQADISKKCVWLWGTYKGHNGYIIVGSTGNAIFLPAAGYYKGGSHWGPNSGYYWSSVIYESIAFDQFAHEANSSFFGGVTSSHLFYGRSVRPVCP